VVAYLGSGKGGEKGEEASAPGGSYSRKRERG
jgi:hypothetical protein